MIILALRAEKFGQQKSFMIRESSILPITQNKKATYKHLDRDDFHTSAGWWHVGAAAGLVGGFLAAVIGLLMSAMSWLAGDGFAVSSIGQTGSWLIPAMIPLMIFGAHCLDKIEAASKAARVERCRQNGMTDEQCK